MPQRILSGWRRTAIGIAVVAVFAGAVALASPNTLRIRLLSAEQTVLPFTGLKDPTSVALGANGDVYVTDAGNRRVLKLAAGSSRQTVLPFTGLNQPGGALVR